MQRNVFNLAQDQYTRTSGPVTCLACSDVTSTSTSTSTSSSNFEGKGQQIWVGLATGYVEEYRMEDSTSTSYSSGSSRSRFDDENTLGVVPQLRLFRSEKVSKKPIDQLCVVSSGESKVLFALSGQHLWMIKDQDQNQHDQGPNQRGFVTQVKESALKGVFFIAQDLCNVGCRNVLALCRTSLAPGLPKKLKLVFLEVSAQTSDSERSVFVLHEQVFDAAKEVVSSSTQVKEAVWYGDSVLLRTDKNYVHLSLSSQSAKEIFAHNNHRTSSHALGGSNSFFSKQDPSSQEQSEVCSHQYMIPIVEKKLTLLLAEDIGTIVNMMGEPTGSMVQFPTEPMAIHAMCYPYLLAVFAKSVYVYDIRKDLRDAHVQTIPFSNYFLSPAKVDRVPVTSWTSVSAEKGENQIFVMVGHNDMLLFLSQTPLEEQCREMLRAHKFKECLQVAYTSQAPNYRDYLIENSCAEAFFHLMERLDVEEALAFLVTCKEFQPSQLFPLFPEYTSVWKTQVVRKRYWSMHPPLASLEDLIKQNANANANASDNNNTGVDKKIKEALVHYLLQIRQNQNQKEKEKGKEKEVFGKEILLVDGVDTLLVQLLLDIGDIEVLEKLATDPNHVVIQQVEARLCSLGRIHALALLNESHKQYRVAAELWVSLCEKKRIELPSPGSFLTRQLSLKPNESLMTVVPLELARVLRKAGTESSATREFLPWLMEHSVDISLTLLSDLSLSVEGIMNMLQATKGTKGSRWKYLDYVVNVKMSTNPMHHSEFAIAMIDLWKSHNNDEDADADGNRPGKELDRKDICSRLEAFLEGSDYYNTQAVILALKGTKLWAEQVIVNKKIGNHKEALHLLAFTMDDRERAVSYCEELGTQEGYLSLLDMFLNPPGEDSLPLYGDAVRLLGSKGASLNPLRVLEALSDNMPMPLAYETLTRMLRERQHRKRSGQIMKGLARAHELSVAQDRVLSLSEHIEMTAERACRVCNLRIGTKVFGLYPNGVLVCYRCMMRNGNKDVQHVCPVTGRNFKKELL